MNTQSELQSWDLWYPQAAATGISFARGRLDQTTVLLVHAPPPMLTVEVRNENGERLAYAKDLAQTADRPIALLVIERKQIRREDFWPTERDFGQSIILPGGEVGKMIHWWNSEDGSEWRWQVEFYNDK